MSNKFTPGPWHVGATSSLVVFAGRISVASAGGHSDSTRDSEQLADEQEANAQVISAAPEMLEALRCARNELHACQAVIHLAGGFDPAYVSGAQKALKIMDAAISKALGETA